VTLFDQAEAERRKAVGMALAADARHELLAAARGFAAFIAREYGTVTADDVAELMAANGLDYSNLGNAAGSVFDTRFQWTGRVIPSKRPSTHGRLIREWSLA
jgi:hypothetical protein